MFENAIIWLIRLLSWPWQAPADKGAWCRPCDKTTPTEVVAGCGIETAGGWTL